VGESRVQESSFLRATLVAPGPKKSTADTASIPAVPAVRLLSALGTAVRVVGVAGSKSLYRRLGVGGTRAGVGGTRLSAAAAISCRSILALMFAFSAASSLGSRSTAWSFQRNVSQPPSSLREGQV
jgi:hypothetical protein